MWTTNYCCCASTVTFHHKKTTFVGCHLSQAWKNKPYELFFPMTIYACYWIYACLFTVSFDKFPNGNEMHLITLNFHLIDETRTFLGFFVPCFDVKTFGYLWKHYMGTAFFWNQLIMKVISVIRFVSWIFYYLICCRHFSHCEAAQRIKGRKLFRMISSSFLFEFCSHISAGKFESS